MGIFKIFNDNSSLFHQESYKTLKAVCHKCSRSACLMCIIASMELLQNNQDFTKHDRKNHPPILEWHPVVSDIYHRLILGHLTGMFQGNFEIYLQSRILLLRSTVHNCNNRYKTYVDHSNIRIIHKPPQQAYG
jgi:hypothetical protein